MGVRMRADLLLAAARQYPGAVTRTHKYAASRMNLIYRGLRPVRAFGQYSTGGALMPSPSGGTHVSRINNAP